MGLPRVYPMATYPYAQDEAEELYYQRVHYLASALLVFGAGDDVLDALSTVYRRVAQYGLERESTLSEIRDSS
jgi:hypothetical protein